MNKDKTKRLSKHRHELKEKKKKHSNRHKHTWIKYQDFNTVTMMKCKDCNKLVFPNKKINKCVVKGCFGKAKYRPPLDTKAWKEICKKLK